MADPGDRLLTLSPLLHQLEPVLLAQDRPVYLVGGAVRDALRDEAYHDLDFAVAAEAIPLAFAVGNALKLPAYALDRERDVGRVVLPDSNAFLDFAAFRGPTLEADLRDRDFTINALALPTGIRHVAGIIDPCDGQADLAAGLIRLTHPQAITADPVRALRALRMVIRFQAVMTADTEQAVRAAAPDLNTISPERVRDELLKLLMSPAPGRAVQMMAALDLLPVILPEIAALAPVEQSPPHHEPVLAHTVSVLQLLADVEAMVVAQQEIDPAISADVAAALLAAQADLDRFSPGLQAHFSRPVDGGLSGAELLRLGALFHDAGKAQTQTIAEGPQGSRIRFLGHEGVSAQLAGQCLRRLHFSNAAVDYVKHIVQGHMRPLLLTQLTRRAIYRYFRATGPAGLDIGLLSLADHLAMYGGPGPAGTWDALLARIVTLFTHYFNHHEETVTPPPLVSGSDIMQHVGIRPGPEVGDLLEKIAEAQATGEIHTSQEALQLAGDLHATKQGERD
jgi:putative nucleotidyltransferase with HDIG domain